MGIAAGIKDITQDIASSYDARVADYDARVAEVKRLKKEANEMLDSFKASQDKMGARLKKELIQGVTGLRSDVKGMLKDFRSSHKQMGTQLRKELANYDRGINGEVSRMRQETRADLRGARTTWQGLAHTMEAKRVGVKVAPEVEIHNLEAKLLAAVNKHPKGVSLAEVAQSLGVVPVVLGRASRSLLKKRLISKKEKLYFPVAGE